MTDFMFRDQSGEHTAYMEARPLFGDDGVLLRVVLTIGAFFALWKLGIALTGNVIWEEGHFVMLGQLPGLAYPDIPAGWPLFARLCTELFGWSAAALRLPALVVAEAIPLAVYWLARAFTSQREALWAAMIAILAPPMAASGTIFYPEEALQIALAVTLGAIIRAVQPERSPAAAMKFWALAGGAAALGLFVHFRFVLVAPGVALFLLVSPVGRRQWLKPGVWVAAAIAAMGLLPSLVYNFREHWPSLAYQVTNRPSYRFNPGWLLIFFENQMGLCTPAFFVAFFASAGQAWRSAWKGESAPTLLLSVGGLLFVVYASISLFDSQVMPHWPFMTYVALTPLAPGVLIRFVDRSKTCVGRRIRMGLIAVFGPALAVLFAVAGTVFEEAWAHADRVPAGYRAVLFTKLEDWNRMKSPLDQVIEVARARWPGSNPVVATAGHLTALRLEFPGRRGLPVYTLDEPYDEFTRFAVIRHRWGLDEVGLRRNHANGAAVLVLPEPTYLYNTPSEIAFRRRLCAEFDAVAETGIVELPPNRVAVELYTARVLPAPRQGAREWCALFPRLYIAQPSRAKTLKRGKDNADFGLASDPKGVTKVEALLDGRVVATGIYGQAPPNAPAPPELAEDPNYPKIWFNYTLPGAALTQGQHRLAIRATLTDGTTKDSAPRSIYVR